MLEEWNTTSHLILTQLINPFHALPFLLFYLATFLHYAFGNQPAILTTSRVIMAFDLELWFLRSFRFVTALKFLGPKLFMLRNMVSRSGRLERLLSSGNMSSIVARFGRIRVHDIHCDCCLRCRLTGFVHVQSGSIHRTGNI